MCALFEATQRRLLNEITINWARATENWLLGLFGIVVGLSIIAWVVFGTPLPAPPPSESTNTHGSLLTTVPIVQYFVRLSLGIITEVLAFYFLSLYRHNTTALKYYENELISFRNIQIACELAEGHADKKIIDEVISTLSKSGRNLNVEDAVDKTPLDIPEVIGALRKVLEVLVPKKELPK